VQVELLPRGQDLVELHLAADASKRRLRELRGGIEKVLHLDDRLHGLDDAEIDDGVDLDGNVVPRDDVLRGDIHGDRPHVHADHAVHDGNEDDEAGPLDGNDPAQPENDGPFIFVEDPDRSGQKHDCQDNEDEYGVHGNPLYERSSTSMFNPLTSTTWTFFPFSMGALLNAFQYSPRMSTFPFS